MIINDKQLVKIKEKLIEAGFNSEISDDFYYYLKKKHVSRYIELIKWMRMNSLEISEKTLNYLYKIDVVLRRIISEILKPIELELQTHLSYFLEWKNIDVQKILSGFIYEDIESIKGINYKNKINTISFVNKAFLKLKTKNIDDIICEFTFGQLSAFLSILKPKILEQIFENFNSKINILKTLDNVVSLRNHIAHHNIIFSSKKFLVNKQSKTIKEIIFLLSFLVNGDYHKKLNDKLEKYKKYLIKRNIKDKKELLNIFKKIKLFLINV